VFSVDSEKWNGKKMREAVILLGCPHPNTFSTLGQEKPLTGNPWPSVFLETFDPPKV
jgi:hypothetical protein